MKLLVVFVAIAALCAGSAIPLIPGDNSHYEKGHSRYIWMPDGEGTPHLVDLQQPVDPSVEVKNGANNQYLLFTRQNPTSHQTISINNANSIWASNYVASRPLVVFVHGWNSNGRSHPNIAESVLAAQDANVIIVDWSGAANNINYAASAAAVPSVGQHLGNFLVWLIATTNGNWNNVHLVGFSLGAHVVGNAGRTAGGRPVRVTGLDPANPGWENNANALARNAGVYVEVIHTDGNSLGLFHPIGDVDFYPNGGTNPQPDCVLSTCSHGRAPDLFASSVRTNHFVGRSCPNVWEANLSTCSGSTFNMGNNILTKRGSGIYHVFTGSSWPF